MAEQAPNFTLQKATIPFEADTQALDLQIDALERRLDGVAAKFRDSFSSGDVFRALDDRLDRLERLMSGTGGGFTETGPTVTGENGVSITPITPVGAGVNDLVQIADDIAQIRLDVQSIAGTLISGGGGA